MKNIITREITTFKEIESIILAFKDTYFLRAITKDDYRKIFIQKHLDSGHFLAEFLEDKPVGFLSFYCNDQINKICFVTSLAVSDSLGFLKGKTLIRLIKMAKEVAASAGTEIIRLEVEKDNDKAIRLYNHFGFKEIQLPTNNEKTFYMEIKMADYKI